MFDRLSRKSGQLVVPRVVLDTNVLISATIIPHGAPALILQTILEGRLTLVTSPFLIDEYDEVIQRPHITKKYSRVVTYREDLLRFLRIETILVAGVPTEAVVAQDPDDDAILACAIEGDADYIVSGDPHLKELGEYRGIKILSPEEFITALDLRQDVK